MTKGRRLRASLTTVIQEDAWPVCLQIPATRSKNREPHNVPLSDQAQRIIDELPKIRNDAGFLFCTNGKTAASGFSRAKSRIDDLAPLTEDWVFHDLRRTIATGMQRLGIPVQVVEKVLNHISGSFAGIVAVYQVHRFDSEKHAALDTWARLVALIVSDPEWIALIAEHLDSKDNKRRKAFIDAINAGGKTWDRYLAKIGGVSGDNIVPIRETA